jgi:hypothetical protein
LKSNQNITIKSKKNLRYAAIPVINSITHTSGFDESYIILLRGINVGDRNLLPMADLRKLLSNNGFSNVKTYIQPRNIFAQSTGTTPGKISSLILREFGFSPETLILDQDEFLDAITNNPFSSDTGKLFISIFAPISQLSTKKNYLN